MKGFMPMTLTPRLHAVASFVPPCDILADIGTDHAYIPIYLAQKGIIKRCIATDIAPGPAGIARANVAGSGLDDIITVVTGNGLEVVEYADVIVIAGMGGKQICDILSCETARKARLLVLQPMTAVDEVRRFLHKKSFTICDECIAKENNKLYNIITARNGAMEIEDDIYYYIGKKLIEKKDPLLGCYIERKVRSFEAAIKSLEKSSSNQSKKEEFMLLKKRFLEVYNDYRS
jgi:tRNA (adenine22-N1)-methyltransferase